MKRADRIIRCQMEGLPVVSIQIRHLAPAPKVARQGTFFALLPVYTLISSRSSARAEEGGFRLYKRRGAW